MTSQAVLIDYACLGVANNNHSNIGTPLSKVLDLGTERGKAFLFRGLVPGQIEDHFPSGVNLRPDAG